MAVEVKTTLRNEDIDDHLDRMEKVRKYADLHGDRREFLSAIAATIVSKSAKEYALKKGLFIIEPSGEDVKITKPVAEKIW
jgi:ribosome biogenesis protein Tsr3